MFLIIIIISWGMLYDDDLHNDCNDAYLKSVGVEAI